MLCKWPDAADQVPALDAEAAQRLTMLSGPVDGAEDVDQRSRCRRIRGPGEKQSGQACA